jgi:hypothetical protein
MNAVFAIIRSGPVRYSPVEIRSPEETFRIMYPIVRHSPVLSGGLKNLAAGS